MASTAREVHVKVVPELSEDMQALLGAATEDTLRKVAAGAALVNAIYHHPHAVDLVKSDFWTTGLSKAYMQACSAYRIGESGGEG